MKVIRICNNCGHKQAIEYIGFGFFEQSKVKWWTICDKCGQEGAFAVKPKQNKRLFNLIKRK